MFKYHGIPLHGPKPGGLSICRNDAGVPLIEAASFQDALWGSGYAHAYDRSTQLLMMRILGQGRLCELLVDDEASFKIDCFFRKANWREGLDTEVAKLDSRSLALSQAYCDGINAGLAQKRFSALRLLGYQAEPWRIQDSMLVSRMASYLTLAQSQAEVERLFVELVQAGVDSELLLELFPVIPASFDRTLLESVHLEERIVPREVLWNLALPRMMASNNWVISGSKTASGKPLMANDPHLEFNRLPNVWCEQSLSWPDQTLKGMGMPGIPGIIIGRSKQLAWGVTYTFMDTIDSWVEECQDGKFRVGDKWIDFDKRIESIKRKKHEDATLYFYENKHGVLDGDPYRAGRYLTTKWIAQNMGAASLMAGLNIGSAQDVPQGMHILATMESAWNWVLADEQGNIGYQMSGLMPLRHQSWNGFTPAPGWDPDYDWKGLVPLEDLPACINPEQGYLVTANQDLNHLGKCQPINMPMGDYRARRIADLISQHKQHDAHVSQAIQMDVYSIQAAEFIEILLPLLKQNKYKSKACKVLKDWDCEYREDSAGASLFEQFYAALRMEVFGKSASGVGPDVLCHLSEQTGVFIDFYQNFDKILLNPRSAWYRQPGNNEPESGQPTQQEAFVNAFNSVKQSFEAKPWKEVNVICFKNILFQGKLPAFTGFDSGPIAVIGGRATPHQGQLYTSAGRETSFGPSVRIVADMGDPFLHTCLAGGPSDNRFSGWYMNELEDWRKGIYKLL